jgi:hypothetical protein
MVFGVVFGGSGSHTDQSADGNTEGGSSAMQTYGDQMSNVSIDLEYGLARVIRPWLVSDLFHIGGWYLLGAKKNSISDGTIEGQVDNKDQLMPMIPTAFLVLRNVKITADNWGQAGIALQRASQAASSASQGSTNSGGGSVGFLCFGATASHSEQQQSGWQNASTASFQGFKFEGSELHGTLSIEGEQIVGWIGEIVPACPATDDPELGKTQKPSATPAPTAAPTAAPSGGPTSILATPVIGSGGNPGGSSGTPPAPSMPPMPAGH